MRKSPDPKLFYDGDPEECRPGILTATNDLISELGFDGITMKMVAERSGLSTEKLEKEYSHKQQILNELIGFHLDVHEGIRVFTRTNPDFSPLQGFQREWELMCEHLSSHQEIIQAYKQYESDLDPWIEGRIKQHRDQDVDLLEKACDMKELPRVNVASLEAVLYGTIKNLILGSVHKRPRSHFIAFPGTVYSMILVPLIAGSIQATNPRR